MVTAPGVRRMLRLGVPALAIAVIIALLSWCASPTAGRLPCKLTWDQALSGANLQMSWLAERAQDGQGVPDWRLLPEPGRHLWATLHFEMAGFTAPSPDSGMPTPPTPEVIADAYATIGLPEAAEAVHELAVLQERGVAKESAEWRRAQQRLGGLRQRCDAVRRSYLLAHRTELDLADR